MKATRKISAAVCGLLALVLLFSIGATSIFASDTQADATKAKPGFLQKMIGHRGSLNDTGTNKIFEKLVTDGVLTQELSDQIDTYLAKKAEERKADLEKIKAMTAEERKAYLEANKPQKKTGLLEDLVAAGIITQEKADEIAKLLPAKKGLPAQDNKRAPMMRGNTKSQYNNQNNKPPLTHK